MKEQKRRTTKSIKVKTKCSKTHLISTVLVITPWVPDHTRRRSRNNAIRRTNRISIFVLPHRRNGQRSRGNDEICEVPRKSDKLRRCDFVERGGCLWGLGYCETSSWGRVGN